MGVLECVTKFNQLILLVVNCFVAVSGGGGERERGREGEMEGGRGEMEFGRERETKWLCCGCWVASLRCSYSVHTCVFRAAQNSAGVYIHLRMVNSKSIEMGNGWIYILTCSL